MVQVPLIVPPRQRLARWIDRVERDRRLAFAVVVLLMAGAIAWQTADRAAHVRDTVPSAVAVAADVLVHADGAVAAGNGSAIAARPWTVQPHVGPGHPLLLAGIASVHPPTEAAILSLSRRAADGPSGSFTSLIVLQYGAALGLLGLVFLIAYRLGGSWEIAVLTLILFFLAHRFGDHAGALHRSTWTMLMAALFLLATHEAGMRQSLLWALVSGVAGAGWILLEPVAFGAVGVGLLLLAVSGGRGSGSLFPLVLSCMAVVGLVAVGVLGATVAHPVLDEMSVLRTLAVGFGERTAFDAMDVQTRLASLIEPVPFLGGLAHLVFPDDVMARLGGYTAGSILRPALIAHKAAMQDVGASPLAYIAMLMDSAIAPAFWQHLITIPSLLLRGLFAGAGIVALAGLFQCRQMWREHRADGRLDGLRLVVGPLVALLVTGALVSANHDWVTAPLAILYAYAVASVAARFTARPLVSGSRVGQPD